MSDGKKIPRRKHRNSKLGCATCKRRRVKCKENLPACSNCLKHGSHCDYLDYTAQQLEDFRRTKLDPDDSLARDRAVVGLELLLLNQPASDQARSSLADGLFEGAPAAGNGSAVLEDRPEALRNYLLDGIREYDMVDEPSLRRLLPTLVHDSLQDPQDLLDMKDLPSLPDLSDDQVPHEQPGPVLVPHSLTQDFDNLLPSDTGKIIYPVYLFDKWNPEPRRDGARASHNGLLNRPARFPRLPKPDWDQASKLQQIVKSLGPLIASGRATLHEIRGLYHTWLASFICSAFKHEIMFLCLVNLTTNYLITNALANPLRDADPTLRNRLVVLSVQHYATVIKQLRLLLNENDNTDLGSSISYILSLMSIFDPEATAYSTTCFRDGLFSVLSYAIESAKSRNMVPSPLVPVHLRLVTNIARTVYLPAYPQNFLFEYEQMLVRFGNLLHATVAGLLRDSLYSTLLFIQTTYSDLCQFCNETLRLYLPTINANLDNIPVQEDVFFTMFRKWANHAPSRLMVVSQATDPLEKVFNLFVRLFRKAVYATIPQIKFCYLRDFDSPLMLDLHATKSDVEILGDLEHPHSLCVDPVSYQQHLRELKELAAYAIRLTTFLNTRIAILYKFLVYDERLQLLYPVTDMAKWRESIQDIGAVRSEYQERMGLVEYPIEEFNKTYISRYHYPQFADQETPGLVLMPSVGDYSPVDLLTLTEAGLLENDERPGLV